MASPEAEWCNGTIACTSTTEPNPDSYTSAVYWVSQPATTPPADAES